MYSIVNKVGDLCTFIILFYSHRFASEIEVDRTSAIDTVVKSDKKRLQLLEEEAELTKKLEGGDVSASERLKEVSCFNSLLWKTYYEAMYSNKYHVKSDLSYYVKCNESFS